MLAILNIIRKKRATKSNGSICKTKTLFRKVSSISRIYIKLTTFWKKKNWSSYLKSFGSDSIRKTGKVSGIRGLVSEHHSAVNVLTYTNTAQVCQRKLLLDVFIILTWINLEKTPFIQVSNLRTVCKSIASQCSLFSRW